MSFISCRRASGLKATQSKVRRLQRRTRLDTTMAHQRLQSLQCGRREKSTAVSPRPQVGPNPFLLGALLACSGCDYLPQAVMAYLQKPVTEFTIIDTTLAALLSGVAIGMGKWAWNWFDANWLSVYATHFLRPFIKRQAYGMERWLGSHRNCLSRTGAALIRHMAVPVAGMFGESPVYQVNKANEHRLLSEQNLASSLELELERWRELEKVRELTDAEFKRRDYVEITLLPKARKAIRDLDR